MRQLTLDPAFQSFSHGMFDVLSPHNQQPIAQAQTLNQAGVERAIERAAMLHNDSGKRLSRSKCIRVFESAIDIFRQRSEQLALDASLEGGKPLADSRIEVQRAIEGLRCCIDALRTETGSVTPMNLGPRSQGRTAYTQRSPIGVVLAYSAFNHPVNLIVHQVCSALAAGCPVVVKPSERTPISCHHVVDCLIDAGLPPEWVTIIHTADLETAEAVVSNPLIAFFSFIGSADIGWRLRSQLAPGTRCALEHGGVAPVIVDRDAQVDDIVPRLARGAFYHAGQVCVSVQRIFVHRDLIDEFARRFVHSAQSYRHGLPDDERTQIGPIISSAARQRIHRWVHDSGGRILCGGQPIEPHSYEATVVLNPKADAQLCTEEVFGPVAVLIAFDQLDSAIDQANALPFTFQSAVCSESIETCLYVADRLAATSVLVNDHTAFRVDWMPFGGHRQSGLGVAGFAHAIREQTVEKQIVFRSRLLERQS